MHKVALSFSIGIRRLLEESYWEVVHGRNIQTTMALSKNHNGDREYEDIPTSL